MLKMATISLLPVMVYIMVSLALAHDTGNFTPNKQGKKELLVRSKRRWDLSTFQIVEEDPGPFPKVVTQMYNDQINKTTQVFQISGNGADEDPIGVFSIGNKNGSLTQHKRIDREERNLYIMRFDIINSDGSKGDKTLQFNVAVKDINDNPPVFEHSIMQESILENLTEGYLPGQLTPTDNDQNNTDNSKISMRVVSQEPASPKISIKEVEGMGRLTFSGCFDYDKVKTYKIIVEAKDHGTPALSSSATVTLNILDSNTHPPVFKDSTYNAEIKEMESNKEILRVAVTDADTPNTPGWRAVYSIVKGNEDGNYKIVTDPKTNEGILTVIKGKDFEKTTLTNVMIAVENEEPLFVCPSGKDTSLPRTQAINVTVKVIDVNDPPKFKDNPKEVFVKEEDSPGKMLYKPVVTDVDSDVKNIRYEVVDPAGWVTIDPKTGEVTTLKPMDLESSYVDKDNIYTILVRAIDDGAPPATATGTVLVHVGDINDHVPHVEHKQLVMCGNKVIVTVEDKDKSPYGCPCSFSLGPDDKENSLKSQWKLEPVSAGTEVVLVSLKSLPYGNYTIPLVIRDQQDQGVNSTVHVLVCDCEKTDRCRALLPRTSSLGKAAIGLLLAGLLLPLLLLSCLRCECGRIFSQLPVYMQDEGIQTLIKYNEEGGVSACKSEPKLALTATSPNPETQRKPFTMVSSSGRDGFSIRGTSQRVGEANRTRTSQIQRGRYQTWNSSRRSTMRFSPQNNSSKYNRSFSLLSEQSISEQIERVRMVGNNVLEQPHMYAYEGTGSKCSSLDQLSLSNSGDDLEFLGDLGPKFMTLGRMCTLDMQEKSVKI